MKFWGYKIRMILQSGTVLHGYVTEYTIRHTDGVLTSVKWRGSMPPYFSLKSIEAIKTKRVINWRYLFKSDRWFG